jgi:hypothetical protein
MGYSLFLFLKSGEYTQTREPQAVSSVGRDMAFLEVYVCVWMVWKRDSRIKDAE